MKTEAEGQMPTWVLAIQDEALGVIERRGITIDGLQREDDAVSFLERDSVHDGVRRGDPSRSTARDREQAQQLLDGRDDAIRILPELFDDVASRFQKQRDA